MRRIAHTMILASAGTGKTHALTTRFIQLLAAGAAPDRIAALTFTRKAAGEFFDRILTRLAGASLDPKKAQELANQIGEPGFSPAKFRTLLRAVVDAMPRLRLGTIDSFFARVVRSFPLELGLAGEFELLEGHGVRLERARVLQRLFAATAGHAPLDQARGTQAQRDFIEAFKRATFGSDEKRIGRRLDTFVTRHHDVLLGAREPEAWGDPARIWPAGSPFLAGIAIDPAAAARELREALDVPRMEDKQGRRWCDFLAGVEAWTPQSGVSDGMEFIFERAAAAWPGLEEIMVERRRMKLSEPARAALRKILRAVIGAEYARRIEMTRGLHSVLSGFETIYHEAVRRPGRLTFQDVQRILEPASAEPTAGRPAFPPLLSRQMGEDRLFIDFRLDAEIDHWLIDEFQDTSFGQWSVLRNLVDEAVQDPTGARSFFYVGDVKQAIFGFREGDSRLFREIFEHYNAARPGTIEEAHLDVSRRSALPIISMVNGVFGAAPVIESVFAGEASRRWNHEWRRHETALEKVGGHAALLHAEGEEGRREATLSVLREIGPVSRKLTCAVLVRKNETATELADYLRRAGGIDAVSESDANPCTDNPAGAALVALVKAAAYPGDTLARAHVDMSPIGGILKAKGIDSDSARTRHVLGRIHAEGYGRAIAGWVRELEPHLAPDDAFTRGRLRVLVNAAAKFDATGSRDAAEFAGYIENYSQHEPGAGGSIRIMTIHKSKGLDFDLVILPDLDPQRSGGGEERLAVHRGPDRSVQWILSQPTNPYASADPVLAAHLEDEEADDNYERLSVLYVAMTRAKRAMYVIAKPPKDSKSRGYPRFLANALGESPIDIPLGSLRLRGAWTAGDPDWHCRDDAGIPPKPVQAAEEIRPVPVHAGRISRRLGSRRPSQADVSHSLDAAALLSAVAQESAEHGTAIHALLAEVEWIGKDGAGQHVDSWRSRGLAPSVVESVERCLQAEGFAEIWSRPAGRGEPEVWRERAFELAAADTWVSGVFDRVLILRDKVGVPISATVYDFKSDRIEAGGAAAAAERHRAQIRSYRNALQRLTGLPPDKIRTCIAFTETGDLVEVS